MTSLKSITIETHVGIEIELIFSNNNEENLSLKIVQCEGSPRNGQGRVATSDMLKLRLAK